MVRNLLASIDKKKHAINKSKQKQLSKNLEATKIKPLEGHRHKSTCNQ